MRKLLGRLADSIAVELAANIREWLEGSSGLREFG
jgi:hypothetical protein